MLGVVLLNTLSNTFLNSASAQDRAPAYPLITHDAYFSIWSFGDDLNKSVTKHWTGNDQSLLGVAKVDGVLYRFLGQESKDYNVLLPNSVQKSYTASYSFDSPSDSWNQVNFNDAAWKKRRCTFRR